MKKTISIRDVALSTIQIEMACISELDQCIDETFEKVIQALNTCKGRIVVTGIGKSAIIGRKYVATFNSTGAPSMFLHAADAVHGDIGMIGSDDMVICLSHSGESPEISVLLPLIKQLNIPVISIVGNKKSYLAENSDYVIHVPINREADPNNLAPTTSTTAQLVIGDAIATSLITLKGFGKKDFAKNHPGGSLGKQLYLTANDLLYKHEKPQIRPDQSIKEVIMEISSKRLGATVVLGDNAVIGIITDGDLRRMLYNNDSWENLTARDIMSANPKSIERQCLAVDALGIMRSHSISQLIEQDNGKYMGMIHLHDIIQEGII